MLIAVTDELKSLSTKKEKSAVVAYEMMSFLRVMKHVLVVLI